MATMTESDRKKFQTQLQQIVDDNGLTRSQLAEIVGKKVPRLKGHTVEELGIRLHYSDAVSGPPPPPPPPPPTQDGGGFTSQVGYGATDAMAPFGVGEFVSEQMGMPFQEPQTKLEHVGRTMGEFIGYGTQLVALAIGGAPATAGIAVAATPGAIKTFLSAVANWTNALAKADPKKILAAEAALSGVAGAATGAVQVNPPFEDPAVNQIAELFAGLGASFGTAALTKIGKGAVQTAHATLKAGKRGIEGAKTEDVQRTIGAEMQKGVPPEATKDLDIATRKLEDEVRQLVGEENMPESPFTTAQVTGQPKHKLAEQKMWREATDEPGEFLLQEQTAKREQIVEQTGRAIDRLPDKGDVPTAPLTEWPSKVAKTATAETRIRSKLEELESVRLANAEEELAAGVGALESTATRKQIADTARIIYREEEANWRVFAEGEQMYGHPAIQAETDTPVRVTNLLREVKALVEKIKDPTTPSDEIPDYLRNLVRALKAADDELAAPLYASEEGAGRSLAETTEQAFLTEARKAPALGPSIAFMPKAFTVYEQQTGRPSLHRLLVEQGGVKRIKDIGIEETKRALPESWMYGPQGHRRRPLDEHISEIQEAGYREIGDTNQLLAALEAENAAVARLRAKLGASPSPAPTPPPKTDEEQWVENITFGQLRRVLSSLGAEGRALQHSREPTAPIHRNVQRLQRAAEEDMAAFSTESGNDTLTIVDRVYREGKARIQHAANRALRQRDLVDAPKMGDEAVVDHFVKTRGENALAFMRAFPQKEEAQWVIESALKRAFYEQTVWEGQYNRTKGRTWMQSHQWVKKDYPAVWEQFNTVTKQEAMVQRLKEQVAQYRKAGVGKDTGSREQRHLMQLERIVTRPPYAQEIRVAQDILGKNLNPHTMADELLDTINPREVAQKTQAIMGRVNKQGRVEGGLLQGKPEALRGFQRVVLDRLEERYWARLNEARHQPGFRKDADTAIIRHEMYTKHEPLLSAVFANNSYALRQLEKSRLVLKTLTHTEHPMIAVSKQDIGAAVAEQAGPGALAEQTSPMISRGYAVARHQVRKGWVALTEAARKVAKYMKFKNQLTRQAVEREAWLNPEVGHTFTLMERGAPEAIVQPRLAGHVRAIFGEYYSAEEEGGSP